MAIPAETLQTMQEQFQTQVRTDEQLNRIRKKIQNGGTFKDAEQYGMRSGQLLSKTLKTNITADLFEDGESLDVSNLASAIIPMMEQNYSYVSTATAAVQKAANIAGGLGMNPVKPEFDRSAAMNIVGRMANYDSFEDAEWMLDEPLVANSVSTVDRTLHDNADFQYRSGLKPKIIRTCEADACPWCQELEGEYDYEEVKEGNSPVYQRHSNCMCEVTFEPGDGRVQDVDSKQWYDDDKGKERIVKHNFLAKNEGGDGRTRKRLLKYQLDLQFFGGKERAEKHAKNWENASLSQTISNLLPDAVSVSKNEEKTIYRSSESRFVIVKDNLGGYFRIMDTSLEGEQGNRRFVGLDGSDLNYYTDSEGNAKRRSKKQYESLTHFKNSDEG